MIETFIRDTCEILHLPVPAVSYDMSRFSSDTMLAQCSPDGSTIYLRKCDAQDPNQFFAAAHELRHIWQMKVDQNGYFDSYKPVDLCASVEEYNLQPAEIDANAFAYVIMTDLFHVKPLFHGLSNHVKREIENRVPYVLQSLK